MKKLYVLLVVVLSSLGAFITFTNETYKDNGKAGNANSPGENSCTQCHGGSINSGTGSMTLNAPDMIGWEYVPGTTYSMSLTVRETGKTIFGIGLEALTNLNTNAGTINVTEASRTQIMASAGRNNLIHKTNGGLSNDSSVFNFSWTAPATDVGTVTFYAAGIAGNNNNGDSGDNTYTTVRTCNAKTNVGISNMNDASYIRIFPNPVSDVIMIEWNLRAIENAQIQLVDMQGKVAASLANNIALEHNKSLRFERPSTIQNGVYFIRIQSGDFVRTSKIIIQ